MPLQHKYRPGDFSEVYGNAEVVDMLKKQLERAPGDRPFAFLITGPAGCGKTTLAYIIRDTLGCWPEDFIEHDASSDRGIDQMRRIRETLGYVPMGPIKIVFFDEVHGITPQAQEAFLKTLEAPPPNTAIILATTNPEKLKTTVKRRCHITNLQPLMLDEIRMLLMDIAAAEGFDDYPQEVIDKIVSVSNNSPGIAVKVMDQIIDLEDFDAIMKSIDNSTYGEVEIFNICRLLNDTRQTAFAKWPDIQKILARYAGDAEGARLMTLEYFRKILVAADPPKCQHVSEMMKFFTDNYYDSGHMGLAMSCFLANFYGVDVGDIPF